MLTKQPPTDANKYNTDARQCRIDANQSLVSPAECCKTHGFIARRTTPPSFITISCPILLQPLGYMGRNRIVRRSVGIQVVFVSLCEGRFRFISLGVSVSKGHLSLDNYEVEKIEVACRSQCIPFFLRRLSLHC